MIDRKAEIEKAARSAAADKAKRHYGIDRGEDEAWAAMTDYGRAEALYEATAAIEPLLDRIQQLEAALNDAREALALGAAVPLADPHILIELRELCERAGYGNVMSSASVMWRERLGELAGSEFVAGPCRSTAESAIAKIGAAIGIDRS